MVVLTGSLWVSCAINVMVRYLISMLYQGLCHDPNHHRAPGPHCSDDRAPRSMGLRGVLEVRSRDAYMSLSVAESHHRDLNPDRIFSNQIINTNNNTVEACLNQCAKFGYPAGGMEFGDECCEILITHLESPHA